VEEQAGGRAVRRFGASVKVRNVDCLRDAGDADIGRVRLRTPARLWRIEPDGRRRERRECVEACAAGRPRVRCGAPINARCGYLAPSRGGGSRASAIVWPVLVGGVWLGAGMQN
jgi:hypothetical protein